MAAQRVAFSIAAFAAGFLLSAALLRFFVPDPLRLHADMRSEKLVLMQQWHGRASAAVFGSSHVHNGFDPRAFDATLAGTPLAETTLNLAVEGGAQTEQHEMALRFVRQLVPIAGQKPLVLLELNAGANLTNDHLVHPRSINLYNVATTRFAWALGSPSLGKAQTWGRRGYALAALALHSANLGMISSRIFSPPLDQIQLAEETAHDRRGLLLPERTPAMRAAMLQQVSVLPAAPARKEAGVMVPAYRRMVDDLRHDSAQPGLQVAYLVTPKLSDLKVQTIWPACIATDGGPVPILSLNRPELYPDLYRNPDNWADDAHLSERGAGLLATHAAEQWLQWDGKGAAVAACNR